jgi:probable phosphoglycerate mutase
VTAEVDPDLAEWDYGALEGRTEQEITDALGRPWSIWNAPASLAPRESLADIAVRADRVIGRIYPLLDAGSDVLLFAHAHLLSILAARWLRLPPDAAAGFGLSPASASVLGYWDGDRAMIAWNFTPWRCASPPMSRPSRRMPRIAGETA